MANSEWRTVNHTRPIWRRLLLHGVLIGGSLLFLLPYLWLLGTSWKLDKEIQSEEIHIFPQTPAPRSRSPYIDERTFPEIKRPEGVDHDRWVGWMRRAIKEAIGEAIDDWQNHGQDPRMSALPADTLREELVEGVFTRLKGILPTETWSAEEQAFRQAVRGAVKPEHINESFDQCYRYFALGRIILKDKNYRIHQLTADRPLEDVWKVTGGPASLEFRHEAQGQVAVAHYDFDGGDSFEVATVLPLGIDFEEFKRLSISFRRDQTWHELRAVIEVNGTRYRSVEPKYLGEDNFWEASFQLPSEDDNRLMPKRYVLLEEDGAGPQYNYGPDVMCLRIQVSRSSTPEAYYAKGTENYREVFDEVPFWRYLKTSAFLAIANIIGTCLSCSLAAYAFARLQWPGRDLCFILVLATLMIPPQVTMIPSFVIYKQLGWYNTLAPLWVPSCLAINAFAIFLLRQAMKGLPRDLEDAAKIDGCGFFRTYWHVALPLMKPTLAAISVFTFMYVWNDFMGPLIYVNDQRLYPLALGLFGFMAGREAEFTLIMAASVVMSLPIITTFFLLQRYFIQGVALTGVKG
ncbi:MAG: carbohydrate ABC transporter permease [Phycisphaerae bacterium]|nr:carbohydrate ABC transporter permease [Phycisphaerae bacterium]